MDSPTPSKQSRRWPGVALLVLLAFAGGVAVGVRHQREQTAAPVTAADSAEPRVALRLYIPKKPARLLVAAQTPDPDAAEDHEEFRKTLAEWLRSRLVLNAALRSPEVNRLPVVRAQEDPVAWLAAALRIDFTGPSVMRVGLDGDATEGLRTLLDAIAAAFLDRVANKESQIRADRLRRLGEVAAEQKESLKRTRQVIAVLRGDGPDQDAVALQLADCRRELRRVRLAVAADAPAKGDPAHEKLRKQEEALLREEKSLEERGKTLNSLAAELAPLQFEVAVQEKLLEQVVAATMRAKAEQDSPARVELMEPATVRGAK